ncbi:hypothetical protein B0H14DRAFT_3157939 [Mycena olivaceomarginata]|nr:hypothetical protein B0H14DRAFT_3157939 [Mycena olivaceomarginata]
MALSRTAMNADRLSHPLSLILKTLGRACHYSRAHVSFEYPTSRISRKIGPRSLGMPGAPVSSPDSLPAVRAPPRDLQRRHRLTISALFSILCALGNLAHDADSHAIVLDNNTNLSSLEMDPGSHQVCRASILSPADNGEGHLTILHHHAEFPEPRVSSASTLCMPLPHASPLPRASPLVLNVAVVDPTALKVAVAAHDLVISLVLYTHHTAVVQAAIKARRCAARAAGIVVLNEARLDPGIVHLSAVKIIDGVHAKGGKVKDFRLQCSALPTPDCTDNPLAERRRHTGRWCRTHGERAAASLPVPGDIAGLDRALEQREDSDASRSFLECMCSRGRWKGSVYSM